MNFSPRVEVGEYLKLKNEIFQKKEIDSVASEYNSLRFVLEHISKSTSN